MNGKLGSLWVVVPHDFKYVAELSSSETVLVVCRLVDVLYGSFRNPPVGDDITWVSSILCCIDVNDLVRSRCLGC